jgi:hypothetical protein
MKKFLIILFVLLGICASNTFHPQPVWATSSTVVTNAQAKKHRRPHVRTYRNSEGKRIQSPTFSRSVPAGASAECRDGSYSFSANRRGTCSHHRGVKRWL